MIDHRNENWQEILKRRWRRKTRNTRDYAARTLRRALRHERLEDRSMFALVGVAPLDPPIISYDSSGSITYDAATDAFSLSAIPLDINTTPLSLFYSGDLNINIRVDAAGSLIGGVAGDDLILTGDVDTNGDFVVDFYAADGPLLTGEILAFGFEDSGGTIDAYDYRFEITGGQLAFLYAGKDLGVTTTAENSTFTGDFGVNFLSNAKGHIGGIAPTNPGIELEKFTNGVDANSEDEAPGIAPGDTVTWTYRVRNTGGTDFSFDQIVITDDAGTPDDPSDDFSTSGGEIAFQSVIIGDADNVLELGEVWEYVATGIAQDLGPADSSATFNFGGNSSLDGPNGNIRTFTADGVSVKASAFSRDKSTGAWSSAWLGSYSGGLGVTDSSESGGNNSHTIDNINSRDNYILFEFSAEIIIDSAYLAYVVGDSDLKMWIGTKSDPFNNHLTLDDGLLDSIGYSEVNETSSSNARTANLNAGGIKGNVIVIAANIEDTPNDKFKIKKLTVERSDCYENHAVVTTGPDGPTDSDVSFYCSPNPGINIEKFTNGIDADSADDAPQIEPGDLVTWTYKVTNIGNVYYATSDVVITDDNGTPDNPLDDFQPVFDPTSDDGDGILAPGETWTFTASANALEVLVPGTSYYIDLSGSSSVYGSAGNVRTYTAGGVSVHASGFSRDKTTGAWANAYLGSYSGGLGVTDASESGANNSHTVDNSGRDNYVLFEFSELVAVDSLSLGYVAGDSDLKIWMGSMTDPFNNHLILDDDMLASLGFNEVNTGGYSTRTADINSERLIGNVLVVAAKPGESNDYFKLIKLKFNKLEKGAYRNVATVEIPGATDNDASYYRNPAPCVDVTFVFADKGHDSGDHSDTWSYAYTTGGYSYSSSDESSYSSGGYSYTSGGDSSTTGSPGNVRAYTQDGVTVNASAFSRTTGGTWSTAYLGAYSDGLGVTDGSESGSGGTHRVDNVGRLNYVLFEFSSLVNIDRAFLDSVDDDSDIQVWIGTVENPIQNHQTLSDGFLAGLGFNEESNASNDTSRWADFNAGGVIGNVLVIAASPTSKYKDDQFKIAKLDVCMEPVKFYVADAAADQTYEYGRGGESLANSNLAVGNGNSRGVATTAAGNKLWVIDGNRQVFVYDHNGNLLGSWAAQGLTMPEDITTDGTNIWILDDGAKEVFQYSHAASRLDGSLSPSNSFSLDGNNSVTSGAIALDAAAYVALRKLSGTSAGYDAWNTNFGRTTSEIQNGPLPPSFEGSAKGIVTDGQHFWLVSDGTDDKVFKYALDGAVIGSWTIDPSNDSPTGITLDPSNVSHLWIVDNADDAVYRYHAATNRSEGNQSADRVFLLASGNGDPQGIADPPPSALEIALAPVADHDVVQTLSREATTGVKERALAEWTPSTKALSSRSASRPGQRSAEWTTTSRSQHESQLSALDAAFESRDDDASAIDDVRDWLYREGLKTPDELVGGIAEDALVAAVAG